VQTMLAHGLRRVLNGETTCDEILAVTGRLDESGPAS